MKLVNVIILIAVTVGLGILSYWAFLGNPIVIPAAVAAFVSAVLFTIMLIVTITTILRKENKT